MLLKATILQWHINFITFLVLNFLEAYNDLKQAILKGYDIKKHEKYF